MNHRTIDSPIGDITLVVTDSGALAGVYLSGQDHLPDAAAWGDLDDTVATDAAAQLGEYFAGVRTTFDLDLAPDGTAFQLRVWEALRAIPYGATETYGALARRIGAGPGASRAVGLANSRNPLAIVVPCHRVIGADGALTGYAGGIERKRWLLDHEGGFLAPRP